MDRNSCTFVISPSAARLGYYVCCAIYVVSGCVLLSNSLHYICFHVIIWLTTFYKQFAYILLKDFRQTHCM
jgi:hypothetical protein